MVLVGPHWQMPPVVHRRSIPTVILHCSILVIPSSHRLPRASIRRPKVLLSQTGSHPHRPHNPLSIFHHLRFRWMKVANGCAKKRPRGQHPQARDVDGFLHLERTAICHLLLRVDRVNWLRSASPSVLYQKVTRLRSTS